MMGEYKVGLLSNLISNKNEEEEEKENDSETLKSLFTLEKKQKEPEIEQSSEPNSSLDKGKQRKAKRSLNHKKRDAESEEDDDDDGTEKKKFTKPSLKSLVRQEDQKKHIPEPEKDFRTVFVGNLPAKTKKNKLKAHFAKCGKIESVRFRGAARPDLKTTKKVAVIKNTFHESRNNINAYICFADITSAKKALKLNRSKFEEFTLRVDFAGTARATTSGPNDSETPHTIRTGKDPKKAIFVGNIGFAETEENLRRHFKKCGKITDVRLVRDSSTGIGKGFGYVNFSKADSVEVALNLNGTQMNNRSLRVQRCAKKAKVTTILEPKNSSGKTKKKNQNEGKIVKKITKKKLREMNANSFQGKKSDESGKKSNARIKKSKSELKMKMNSRKLLAK